MIQLDRFAADELVIRRDSTGMVIEAPGLVRILLRGLSQISPDNLRFQ